MLKATRDGFGEGLLDLGQIDPKVLVVSADLAESTRSIWFAQEFPQRFIEVGVAEQNMIGIAAGLAQEGFVPFCASFAEFSPGRNWEQIKVSVCYNQANVKIASTHAGLSVGYDGGTHQMLEDIALMRVLPKMIVLSPADVLEARKATLAAALYNGPCYLRFSRQPSPIITTEQTPFIIGQGLILQKGSDLTVLSHGLMTSFALNAAQKLKTKFKIEVINLATIKPLDTDLILKSMKKTGRLLVIEEAQKRGALFSEVVENLINQISQVEVMAVEDCFGQSGESLAVLDHYQLSESAIIKKITEILKG